MEYVINSIIMCTECWKQPTSHCQSVSCMGSRVVCCCSIQSCAFALIAQRTRGSTGMPNSSRNNCTPIIIIITLWNLNALLDRFCFRLLVICICIYGCCFAGFNIFIVTFPVIFLFKTIIFDAYYSRLALPIMFVRFRILFGLAFLLRYLFI